MQFRADQDYIHPLLIQLLNQHHPFLSELLLIILQLELFQVMSNQRCIGLLVLNSGIPYPMLLQKNL